MYLNPINLRAARFALIECSIQSGPTGSLRLWMGSRAFVWPQQGVLWKGQDQSQLLRQHKSRTQEGRWEGEVLGKSPEKLALTQGLANSWAAPSAPTSHLLSRTLNWNTRKWLISVCFDIENHSHLFRKGQTVRHVCWNEMTWRV